MSCGIRGGCSYALRRRGSMNSCWRISLLQWEAGRLSQFVSQQEYSKLFETDGLGANFQGQWRTDDEVFATASVFGSQGPVEFGLDVNYRNASGLRTNNQSELLEINLQGKWQPNPDNIFYFLGRNGKSRRPAIICRLLTISTTSPFLDFEENQRPGLLLAGWNHRWKPGVHTLVIGWAFGGEAKLCENPQTEQLRVVRNGATALVTRISLMWSEAVRFNSFKSCSECGSVQSCALRLEAALTCAG